MRTDDIPQQKLKNIVQYDIILSQRTELQGSIIMLHVVVGLFLVQFCYKKVIRSRNWIRHICHQYLPVSKQKGWLIDSGVKEASRRKYCTLGYNFTKRLKIYYAYQKDLRMESETVNDIPRKVKHLAYKTAYSYDR
jgi:hypothetical protein